MKKLEFGDIVKIYDADLKRNCGCFLRKKQHAHIITHIKTGSKIVIGIFLKMEKFNSLTGYWFLTKAGKSLRVSGEERYDDIDGCKVEKL